MNKLMLVAAGLVAASLTSQAAITQVGAVTDTATSLVVSGTWTIPDVAGVGASFGAPLSNWQVDLYGKSLDIGGGVVLNILQASGQTIAYGPATTGTGALGLLNVDLGGPVSGPVNFVDGAGATYTLTGYVSPAGTSNRTVTGAIPDPSTYAMIAGLGLVGFAGYRRMRG